MTTLTASTERTASYCRTCQAWTLPVPELDGPHQCIACSRPCGAPIGGGASSALEEISNRYIVTCGLPEHGSFWSQHLFRELERLGIDCRSISPDDVREGMSAVPQYTREEDERVYEEVWRLLSEPFAGITIYGRHERQPDCLEVADRVGRRGCGARRDPVRLAQGRHAEADRGALK